MKESSAENLVNAIIEETVFFNPEFTFSDIRNECIKALDKALSESEFFKDYFCIKFK